jgi:hypothetical protein
MRLSKRFSLIAVILLSIAGMIIDISCKKKKDPCSGVTCHHGGACMNGTCICPSGLYGKLCDTVYKLAYTNTYKGDGTDNEGASYLNFHLVLAIADTYNTKLVMNIRDASGDSVGVPSLTIELTGFSAAGASFIINPAITTTDTFTGSGTISASKASLVLRQVPVSGNAVAYTFSGLTKQ